MPLRFDLLGRVNNLKIPDQQEAILYSCFEAISNSVHAIEERYKSKATELGKINIHLSLDAKRKINFILISDNGVGLNEKNYQSFETSDSQSKISFGGKGVGRLIWLKVFETTEISSTYSDTAKHHSTVSFLFELDPKEPIKKYELNRGDRTTPIGTSIKFLRPRSEFDISIRPSAFIRDIVLQFFSYFVSHSMPNAILTVESQSKSGKKKTRDVDLREHIQSNIIYSTEDKHPIVVGENTYEFHLHHIFASKKISNKLKNTILLSAHRRVVEKNEIQNKFALNKLKEKNAYVMVASSTILDQRVDQERTGFKLANRNSSK